MKDKVVKIDSLVMHHGRVTNVMSITFLRFTPEILLLPFTLGLNKWLAFEKIKSKHKSNLINPIQ